MAAPFIHQEHVAHWEYAGAPKPSSFFGLPPQPTPIKGATRQRISLALHHPWRTLLLTKTSARSAACATGQSWTQLAASASSTPASIGTARTVSSNGSRRVPAHAQPVDNRSPRCRRSTAEWRWECILLSSLPSLASTSGADPPVRLTPSPQHLLRNCKPSRHTHLPTRNVTHRAMHCPSCAPQVLLTPIERLDQRRTAGGDEYASPASTRSMSDVMSLVGSDTDFE